VLIVLLMAAMMSVCAGYIRCHIMRNNTRETYVDTAVLCSDLHASRRCARTCHVLCVSLVMEPCALCSLCPNQTRADLWDAQNTQAVVVLIVN
jgi:uncharacterized membrane protein